MENKIDVTDAEYKELVKLVGGLTEACMVMDEGCYRYNMELFINRIGRLREKIKFNKAATKLIEKCVGAKDRTEAERFIQEFTKLRLGYEKF